MTVEVRNVFMEMQIRKDRIATAIIRDLEWKILCFAARLTIL